MLFIHRTRKPVLVPELSDTSIRNKGQTIPTGVARPAVPPHSEIRRKLADAVESEPVVEGATQGVDEESESEFVRPRTVTRKPKSDGAEISAEQKEINEQVRPFNLLYQYSTLV